MKSKGIGSFEGLIFIMLIVAIVSSLFLFTGCGSKTEIYENENFGFSILMSEEFASDIEIKEAGNIIFFEAANLAWGDGDENIPTIGRIEIYDKDDYTSGQIVEMAQMYNLKIIEENQQYYFGAAHATDVQMMPGSLQEDLEGFGILEADFDQVMDTFELNPAEY